MLCCHVRVPAIFGARFPGLSGLSSEYSRLSHLLCSILSFFCQLFGQLSVVDRLDQDGRFFGTSIDTVTYISN